MPELTIPVPLPSDSTILYLFPSLCAFSIFGILCHFVNTFDSCCLTNASFLLSPPNPRQFQPSLSIRPSGGGVGG